VVVHSSPVVTAPFSGFPAARGIAGCRIAEQFSRFLRAVLQSPANTLDNHE
jgi:hypothetical protein